MTKSEIIRRNINCENNVDIVSGWRSAVNWRMFVLDGDCGHRKWAEAGWVWVGVRQVRFVGLMGRRMD